jgi:hypothetical protein
MHTLLLNRSPNVLVDRLFLASIVAGKASVYFWLGDAKTALEYDEQAITIFKEIDASWGAAEITLDLGRVHNSTGQSSEVARVFE